MAGAGDCWPWTWPFQHCNMSTCSHLLTQHQQSGIKLTPLTPLQSTAPHPPSICHSKIFGGVINKKIFWLARSCTQDDVSQYQLSFSGCSNLISASTDLEESPSMSYLNAKVCYPTRATLRSYSSSISQEIWVDVNIATLASGPHLISIWKGSLQCQNVNGSECQHLVNTWLQHFNSFQECFPGVTQTITRLLTPPTHFMISNQGTPQHNR